jgi:acyl-CoA dehydrogenase
MATDTHDDTHDMLRKTARDFATREILPHVDAWEEAGTFPRDLYRKAAKAGLLGIGYPEALGGAGGDLLHKLVWVEELMRAGSGGLAASLGSLDIALPPLLAFGPDALKQAILPRVLSGDWVAALAITEPGGGSDVSGLRTCALRKTVDGQEVYEITGTKTFITSGHRADIYTVAVRTGDGGHAGLSLIAVPRATPGFSAGPPMVKMGWHASDTAELAFDACRVPAANLIGQEGRGFAMITANFESERLVLAAMANVTSELALEAALEHARTRQAFGSTLAGHQVIRHRLAEMATALEASRALTARAAQRLVEGHSAMREVVMAKNMATDTCDRITRDAVQVFGGAGYMRGTLVERLFRDARILSIGGGTREIMNEIIAKRMGL